MNQPSGRPNTNPLISLGSENSEGLSPEPLEAPPAAPAPEAPVAICRPVRAFRRLGRTTMRARHSSSPLIKGAPLPQSPARRQAGTKPDGTVQSAFHLQSLP